MQGFAWLHHLACINSWFQGQTWESLYSSSCYGRSDNGLPRPILIFVAAKKNSFACSCRDGNDLPRPILIFFAATENGSACSSSTKTAKIEVEIGQLLQ